MSNWIALSVLREQTPRCIQDTCTFRLAELLRLTDPEPLEGLATAWAPLVLAQCGGQAHFTALSVPPSQDILGALEPCAGVLTLNGEAHFRIIQGAQALSRLRAAHTESLALGALPGPVLLLHPLNGGNHA